jgi:hypothetical protein
MKWFVAVLALCFCGITIPLRAQPRNVLPDRATVCEIAKHPSHFVGKRIELRARIWPDSNYAGRFWVNEPSMDDGVCAFLRARFSFSTDLAGQTAFATFIGTIVPETVAHRKAPVFLIEAQSDVYLRRDYLNGPIPILQLYDVTTRSIVRPQ